MKRIWKYFVRIVGVVVLSLILIVAGQLFYVRYFGFHCIQGNCRSGIGVKEFNNTRYSGEFKNYRLNGKGKAEYYSGCFYEGSFVNGYYDGYGVYSCWNMKPLEDRKNLYSKDTGFKELQTAREQKRLLPVNNSQEFGKMADSV